jgi:fatty acid desaturase
MFKTRTVEDTVLGLYMKKNEDWRKYHTHTHTHTVDVGNRLRKTNVTAESERKEYKTPKT